MSLIRNVSLACKVFAVVLAFLSIAFVVHDNERARLACILSSSIFLALGSFLSYLDRRRNRDRH